MPAFSYKYKQVYGNQFAMLYLVILNNASVVFFELQMVVDLTT